MGISDPQPTPVSSYVLHVRSIAGGADISYIPTGRETLVIFQNQSTSEIVCKPIVNDVDRAAGTAAATDGIILGAAPAGTNVGQSLATGKLVEWRFRSLGADNVHLYIFPQE